MDITDSISILRKAFPKQNLPNLIRSLKRNALLWQSIGDPGFVDILINQLGTNWLNWTPANVGFIKAGISLSSEDLYSHKSEPLPEEIQKRVSHTYNRYRQDPEFLKPDLTDSVMLGLAFREKARIMGNWDKLWDEQPANKHFMLLQGLIHVYSMLSNPEPYFLTFCQQSKQYELCAHAIYTQPIERSTQSQIIARLGQTVRAADRLQLLIQLEYVQSLDAEMLANELLHLENLNSKLDKLVIKNTIYNNQAVWQVPELLYIAEVFRLAGKTERSIQTYHQLSGLTTQLLSAVETQRLSEAVKLKQFKLIDDYLDDQGRHNNLDDVNNSHVALKLIQSGESNRVIKLIETVGEHPSARILKALILFEQQNFNEAKYQLISILESIEDNQTINPEFLCKAANILLDLERPLEAVAYAKSMLLHQPEEPEAYYLLARGERIAGNLQSALELAQIATILAPDNLKYLKEFAEALEANGNWEEALSVRRIGIFSGDGKASAEKSAIKSITDPNDLRSIAISAMHANKNEDAIMHCEELLKLFPDDGLTHIVLGNIHQKNNQPELALEEYKLANQLSPEEPLTWLSLAEAYKKNGNKNQAINTLRTAIQAVPDHPLILIELAELYFSTNQPSQALNLVEKAAELTGLPYQKRQISGEINSTGDGIKPYLTPQTGRIALLLGKLSFELGHTDQAENILRYAYETPDYKNPASYLLAKTLLQQEKEREALSAFSLAYQIDPDNVDLALEYSELLIKLGEHPEEAADILGRVIEYGITNPEIKALLAEALAGCRDYQTSLTYYKEVMDSALMKDPIWAVRLALGLSHVSIHIGSPDLAVAALQDASAKAPKHLDLHQKLAEACLAAELTEDAIETAQQAYDIAPADIENLIWYSTFCANLQNFELAARILQDASELSPNNPELLIRLGQINLENTDFEKARWAFVSAANLPDITLKQLQSAASGLLTTGNPEDAVMCLEKVKSLISTTSDVVSEPMFDLLIQAYKETQDYQNALNVIEHALVEDPSSLQLLKQKAKIHIEMSQYKAAEACLIQILNQTPDDADSYQMLSSIYEKQQNLQSAYESACKYFLYAPDNLQDSARYLAARLAWKLFHEEETHNYLFTSQRQNQSSSVETIQLEQLLFQGILALQKHDQSGLDRVIHEISSGQRSTSALPALESVQMVFDQKYDEARIHYREAIDIFNQSQHKNEFECEVLFESSFLLGDYDSALHVIQQWKTLDNSNPRVSFSEIKTLTRRAELKHFFNELKVLNHGPDSTALSSSVNIQINSNWKTILNLLGIDTQIETLQQISNRQTHLSLNLWKIRSEIAFSQDYPYTFDDFQLILTNLDQPLHIFSSCAAFSAALKRKNHQDQSIKLGKKHLEDPEVLAQLALTYQTIDSTMALGFALDATEIILGRKDEQMLPVYQALISYTASQGEQYNQAYQAIRNALADWSDEIHWHSLAASLAAQVGEIGDSIRHLERAVELKPDSTEYRNRLGNAYLQTGMLNRAGEVYQELCELAPNQDTTWIKLGQIFADQGKYEQAFDCIEKACEISPNNQEYMLFAAEISFALNKYTQSYKFAEEVLARDRSSALAAYLVAKSLAQMNRKQEAAEILESALDYPDRPLDLYLERIKLMRSIQGLDAAYHALLMLNDQKPDHPAILGLLANYQQELGLLSDALSNSQRALKYAESEFSPSEKSNLHALAGKILHRSGHLDQAIHELSQALALDPQNINLYLDLGKTYQDRRQSQEALDVYQKAINISPEDPRPYQQAGLTLKECKDYLGAEKMIRQAAELSPHDIGIHRLLGSLVALNLVHNTQ